ncbi:FlhC family transcriptional regulator, partial [Achromobacter sp. 2789STDY5608628]
MATKSVSQEADDILLASSMITLGARLQVLEAETSLSHDRLARLYREIRGCSPPKGMLPFSVDWFMTWLPNIHSSLFYNVYSFLNTRTSSKGIRAIIDAYRLYLENAGVDNAESAEPVLSFT